MRADMPLNRKSADGPESAAYRWYMLAVLLGIYMAGSIDRSMISVVLEPIKTEFKLSDASLGLLSGVAFSVPFACAVLPLGWLIDRYERRSLLGLLCGLWSLLTFLGAFAGSYVQLLATRFVVGAADAGQAPASLSLIADTFPPNRRSTAIGIFSSGAALSVILIFLLGGWVLAHFGWRSVFLVAGLPGIAMALLVLFTFREPRRGQYDGGQAVKPERLSIRASTKIIFGRRSLVHSLIAYMLATGVQITAMIWLVSFLTRVHGMQPSAASIWIGVLLGIAQALGALVIGPIADRYSRGEGGRLANVPAIGAAVAFISGIAMCLAPSLEGTLAAMTVLGFCAGVFTGTSYSLMVTLSPPTARGSALAIAKMLSLLVGQGFFSFMTGKVSDLVGGTDSIRIALMVTLTGHLWAAVHFYLAGRAARGEKTKKVVPFVEAMSSI
jgi:predicted MFS family arabinose efflux permease